VQFYKTDDADKKKALLSKLNLLLMHNGHELAKNERVTSGDINSSFTKFMAGEFVVLGKAATSDFATEMQYDNETKFISGKPVAKFQVKAIYTHAHVTVTPHENEAIVEIRFSASEGSADSEKGSDKFSLGRTATIKGLKALFTGIPLTDHSGQEIDIDTKLKNDGAERLTAKVSLKDIQKLLVNIPTSEHNTYNYKVQALHEAEEAKRRAAEEAAKAPYVDPREKIWSSDAYSAPKLYLRGTKEYNSFESTDLERRLLLPAKDVFNSSPNSRQLEDVLSRALYHHIQNNGGRLANPLLGGVMGKHLILGEVDISLVGVAKRILDSHARYNLSKRAEFDEFQNQVVGELGMCANALDALICEKHDLEKAGDKYVKKAPVAIHAEEVAVALVEIEPPVAAKEPVTLEPVTLEPVAPTEPAAEPVVEQPVSKVGKVVTHPPREVELDENIELALDIRDAFLQRTQAEKAEAGAEHWKAEHGRIQTRLDGMQAEAEKALAHSAERGVAALATQTQNYSQILSDFHGGMQNAAYAHAMRLQELQTALEAEKTRTAALVGEKQNALGDKSQFEQQLQQSNTLVSALDAQLRQEQKKWRTFQADALRIQNALLGCFKHRKGQIEALKEKLHQQEKVVTQQLQQDLEKLNQEHSALAEKLSGTKKALNSTRTLLAHALGAHDKAVKSNQVLQDESRKAIKAIKSAHFVQMRALKERHEQELSHIREQLSAMQLEAENASTQGAKQGIAALAAQAQEFAGVLNEQTERMGNASLEHAMRLQELQDALAEEKAKVAQLEKEKQAALGDASSLTEGLASAEDHIRSLTGQIRREKKVWKSNKEEISHIHTILLAHLYRRSQQVASLTKRLQHQEQEVEPQLREQIASLMQSNSELQSQLENSKKALDASQQLFGFALDAHDKATTENETLTRLHEEELARVKNQMVALERETKLAIRQSANAGVVALAAQSDFYKQEITQLRMLMEVAAQAAVARQQSLQKEIDAGKAKVTQLESEKQSVEKSKTDKERDLEQAHEKIQLLEQDLKSATAYWNARHADAVQMQGIFMHGLFTCADQIGSLQETLRKQKSPNAQLVSDLEKMEQSNRTLTEQLHNATASGISDLARDRILKLEGDLQNAANDAAILEHAHQLQLAKLKDEQQKELAAAERRVAELTEQTNTAITKNAEMGVIALFDQQRFYQQELAKLQALMELAAQAAVTRQQALQNDIEAEKEKVRQLESEKQGVTEEKAQKINVLEQAQGNIRLLETKLQSVTQYWEARHDGALAVQGLLMQGLATCAGQIDSLNKSLLEKESSNSRLSADLKELGQSNRNLTEKLHNATASGISDLARNRILALQEGAQRERDETAIREHAHELQVEKLRKEGRNKDRQKNILTEAHAMQRQALHNKNKKMATKLAATKKELAAARTAPALEEKTVPVVVEHKLQLSNEASPYSAEDLAYEIPTPTPSPAPEPRTGFSNTQTWIGAAALAVTGLWVTIKSFFGGKDEKKQTDGQEEAPSRTSKIAAGILGLALLGGGGVLAHRAMSR